MVRLNLQLFAWKPYEVNASIYGEEDRAKTKNPTTGNSTSQSGYTASSKVTNAQKEADNAYANFKSVGGAGVSQKTWDAINKPSATYTAYKNAMDYTNGRLEKMASGRTSYTDQIQDLMGQIKNRDPFEYDMNTDTLFQQYLGSMMADGKVAMQDTIGQASALTGGYGSTYATTAGNQAYNSYIQDAYSNLPEYYQMAMEAYEMEGNELYNQLAMLNNADAAEYQRMYDDVNLNLGMAQQLYGEYQDGISNAFNSANLQLSQQAQAFDQAYQKYGLAQSKADELYTQDYQKWAMDNGYVVGDDGAVTSGRLDVSKIPSAISKKASSFENDGELGEFLDAQVDAGAITEEEADYLYATYKSKEQLPLTERTWTMTDDGGRNYFGKIDRNGYVKDQYGNDYKLADLFKELKKTMSKEEARNWIIALQKEVGIDN